jgi:tRNA threonylcarbamoyladenosine biosynthesis protein TsaE
VKILLTSEAVSDTRAVGEALAGCLIPRGVLLLSGDLGSGKTVLTRGLAEGLGIEPTEVQSPTFTLIREHQGTRGDLVHIDLYRLEGQELEALGLWEILAGPGVKAVEWSERMSYPIDDAIRATLRVSAPTGREIEIEAVDSEKRLQDALALVSARLA